ncbi:hypothetical protein Pmani_015903 [Petrolisthes manimaculis]|uniref:Uncharacterized protein n=1 Tax=Petrolisthes manimaculis TaxID=1843537 RepID=A0AAE1UB56_9EUCA|nr:hypothetical protein Pmani_015903 [Petrolisthes manimaculis]
MRSYNTRHLRAEGKAWQEEGRWWEAWEERGQSVGRQLHPIQGHHERLGRTFYIGIGRARFHHRPGGGQPETGM